MHSSSVSCRGALTENKQKPVLILRLVILAGSVNLWQEPGLTMGSGKEEVLPNRWKTNIILHKTQTTGSEYLRGNGLYLFFQV